MKVTIAEIADLISLRMTCLRIRNHTSEKVPPGRCEQLMYANATSVVFERTDPVNTCQHLLKLRNNTADCLDKSIMP